MQDVIVVGAGPVGLFLANRLLQLGISVSLIEKHTQRREHSRSIGIHPPSLEKLELLGCVSDFLAKGVKVRSGLAFSNAKLLAELSFSSCPKPYDFVLTLAQHETEAILEQLLINADSSVLCKGVSVTAIQQNHDSVELKIQDDSGAQGSLSARYVVACDGKNSDLRTLSEIPFIGKSYPDTYIMGDFADNTNLASAAGIYLCKEGLIESFPLPNQSRRWVAKTKTYLANPSKEQLAQIIKERLEHDLAVDTNTMMSGFGVQRYLAKTFVKDRLLLAGDAAHILSPIGGQGMNLGWLDAWSAAGTLKQCLEQPIAAQTYLNTYTFKRQKSARIAILRAAFNMHLGRQTKLPKLKNAFVKAMLKSPLERYFATIFTMRGL